MALDFPDPKRARARAIAGLLGLGCVTSGIWAAFGGAAAGIALGLLLMASAIHDRYEEAEGR